MSRAPSIAIPAFAIAMLALAGCIGVVEDGAAGPRGSRPGPTPAPTPPPSLCTEQGAPARLRRLAAVELEATLREVFALDAALWAGPALPPDPASADGFNNDASRLRVTEGWAARLGEAARGVADVVAAPPTLSRVLPCAPSGGESCARSYLDTIARRLYRRSLTDAERDRYLAMRARVEPAAGFAAWVRAATLAMVQSPHVVWRSELGEERAGARRMSGVELASALSYDLTGQPPSAELIDRAERGELETDAELRAAATALAIDEGGALRPAFVAQAERFFEPWLGLSPLANLSKDPAMHPEWTPEVRDALRRETRAFVRDALERRAGIAELFASGDTYVDASLARYYGWSDVSAPDGEMVRVARPEGRGLGLFGQGAWLAVYAASNASSPTRRGHFVRERILCGEVPPPPATVGEITPPSETNTTRERYEALHATRDDCRGCHRLMDPIGFTLEHFDAAGRWRDREGAFAIRDDGSIASTSRGDVAIEGPDELAATLADLPEVRACFGSYVAAYVHGTGRREASCVGEHLARDASDDLANTFLEATLRPLSGGR